LQVNDIAVVGMAKGDDRPARAFRELADHVIEHEAFLAAFAYKREKSRLLGRSSSKRPPTDDKQLALPMPPVPRKAPGVAKVASVAANEKSGPMLPAPAPMKKTASRRKPRRKSANAGDARLAAAVDAVARAAATSPSANLSKKFVCRSLESFDGFCTTGAGSWLGCTNYPTMIRKFADLSREFEITEHRNGGINLVYRGPDATPSP
jgi:hypothetical protein